MVSLSILLVLVATINMPQVAGDILSDAEANFITFGNGLNAVVGPPAGTTFSALGNNVVEGLGGSVALASVTVADIQALCPITLGQLVDVLNDTASNYTFTYPNTTLATFPVGGLNAFLNDFFAVANGNPTLTFNDIPLASGNLGYFGNFTLQEYFGFIATFINSVGNISDSTFATLRDALSASGLYNVTLCELGLIPDFTANITTPEGLNLTGAFTDDVSNGLSDVVTSVSSSNTCGGNADCSASGGGCCNPIAGSSSPDFCCSVVDNSITNFGNIFPVPTNSPCDDTCPPPGGD